MRHAILGAGGIGGLMAANLARCGHQVTLVLRPDVVGNYPPKLELESPFGNASVEVERAATAPAADVLWIAVKALQLEAALSTITDAGAIGMMVPLLNGIDHVAMLRSKYGASRVVAATISVESERSAPGHIVQRSPFARLNVSSEGRSVLEGTLNCLQQLGFTCKFVDDEPTLLWSKLVFLAPLALATTAAGAPKGGVFSDPQRRQQLQDCVREACAVAKAERADVDADAVIATIAGLPPHMKSSMQKDVERGKTPELQAIAGPILTGATRHKIQVTATRALVSAIEQKIKVLA